MSRCFCTSVWFWLDISISRCAWQAGTPARVFSPGAVRYSKRLTVLPELVGSAEHARQRSDTAPKSNLARLVMRYHKSVGNVLLR
jgi:hypothetical protein